MLFGYCAPVAELEAVSRAGFDFVELRGKEVAALSEADFAALCALLARLGLPCRGFNAYCGSEITIAGPRYDRQANRAYAALLARRGRALGIAQAGVGSPFSRRLPEGFDRALASRQVAEFLADADEFFAPEGIRVGMEALAPEFCNCVNLCDEAADLARAVPGGRVGLILDFYNMERNGEAERELDSLLPLILHVHISDDAGDPFRRSLPRPEKYPLHRQRLLRLRRAGYDGSVSIETDLPLDETAGAEALAFLRSL